jgi:hypothetical protein
MFLRVLWSVESGPWKISSEPCEWNGNTDLYVVQKHGKGLPARPRFIGPVMRTFRPKGAGCMAVSPRDRRQRKEGKDWQSQQRKTWSASGEKDGKENARCPEKNAEWSEIDLELDDLNPCKEKHWDKLPAL